MTTAHIPNLGISTDTPLHFEDRARGVFAQIQESLRRLVAAAGSNGKRAVDVERTLKIDHRLAWQIFKIMDADDPLLEVDKVPIPAGVQRLLTASAKVGISDEVCQTVEQAFSAFETLIDQEAGSRDLLETMLAGLTPERSDVFHPKLRRQAFDVQTQIWGYYAEAMSRTSIFHPATDEKMLDSVAVIIANGLHQIRRQAELRIEVGARRHLEEDDKATVTLSAQHKWSLLRPFCRGDIPQTFDAGTNAQESAFVCKFADIGRTAAVDLALTMDSQGTSRRSIDEDHGYASSLCVGAPTKVLYQDLLVPAGWTTPANIRAQTFFNFHRAGSPFLMRPEDVLPMRDLATYCGRITVGPGERRTSNVPVIPEMPRFGEILRGVCQDRGWIGTQFDFYRRRVEYPIVHSVVYLRVDGKAEK